MCWCWSPAASAGRARRDWETYRALMEPAQVQLYLDYAETHTPALVLTDSYALMEECIETPRLILLRKDEERLLILPRRCFAEQADGETALEFLRQTFARKRQGEGAAGCFEGGRPMEQKALTLYCAADPG